MGPVKRLALLICLVAFASALAACGGSDNKNESSSTGTTSTTAASDAERPQAKAALTKWITLTEKLDAAGKKYGTDEPQHAHEQNLLAMRRDGYDLRNAIYRFDLAVRKVEFPPSLQPRVNELLTTTGKMVAALDGMSQSSKAEDVNGYIRKANAIDLKTAVNTLNVDLHKTAGEPLPTASTGAGGSEADKVAAGLLKAKAQSGAKGPDDAACAGKELVEGKTLDQAELDKIAAGEIPQSGPASNAVGAALVVCQFKTGQTP
jgi:hypothetical protein